MQLSTSLLALGRAGKPGEQDHLLENLVCGFTELGGRKLPWIKACALGTRLE